MPTKSGIIARPFERRGKIILKLGAMGYSEGIVARFGS